MARRSPTPTKPNSPLRVIGGIRVSLAREEMISPEVQRTAIERWARDQRPPAVIVGWTEDLGKTGRTFKRDIQNAIARIEHGDADAVVVYRYDRWGRNALDSLVNIQRVEAAGGRVVSVTEPVDPGTSIGRYNRTNALALAELQSDIIGDNWRAAQDARRTRGLPHDGKPRFGYIRRGRVPAPPGLGIRRWVPDPDDPVERYEPDPDTAAWAEQMYLAYVSGSSPETIGAQLHAAGITTVSGARWTGLRVTAYLDSGFAAGMLRRHDDGCGCTHMHLCPNVTYERGAHEAIISEQLWRDYLAARASRRRRPSRQVTATYPLSGVVRCGGCGGPTHHATPGRNRSRLWIRCAHRYTRGRDVCTGASAAADEVEEYVLAELLAELPGLEAAAARQRVEVAQPQQQVGRRAWLVAEIERRTTALARAARARLLDGTPDDIYQTVVAELQAERDQLQAELDALGPAPAEIDHEQRVQVVRGLAEEWPTLPPEGINTLLRSLGAHVTIWRQERRGPLELAMSWAWSDWDAWEPPGSVVREMS